MLNLFYFLLNTLFFPDFFIPNVINIKLSIAKKGAAGMDNMNDIKGCQMNPEQFKTSKAEHGSMYLLTIDSVNCRLLGEK